MWLLLSTKVKRKDIDKIVSQYLSDIYIQLNQIKKVSLAIGHC